MIKKRIILIGLLIVIVISATAGSFSMTGDEAIKMRAYIKDYLNSHPEGINVDYNNDGVVSYEESGMFDRIMYNAAVKGDTSGLPAPSVTPQNTASNTNFTKNTNKHEHTYVATVIKEATCKDEGETSYKCSGCGDEYTEIIAPTGEHHYVSENTVIPDCVNPGVITYTCKDCGDTYTEEVEPTGKHDYHEEITKQPTCTQDGVKTFTCSVCGDSYEEKIPALGHDPAAEWVVVKESNDFIGVNGLEELRCNRCNELLDSHEIQARNDGFTLVKLIVIIAVILIGIVAFVVIRWAKK